MTTEHDKLIASLSREVLDSHVLLAILLERAGGEIRITDEEVHRADPRRLVAYRDNASHVTIYRLLTRPDALTSER